jgi:hypothetical protein
MLTQATFDRLLPTLDEGAAPSASAATPLRGAAVLSRLMSGYKIGTEALQVESGICSKQIERYRSGLARMSWHMAIKLGDALTKGCHPEEKRRAINDLLKSCGHEPYTSVEAMGRGIAAARRHKDRRTAAMRD